MCTDVYVGYHDGAALADLPIMIRNVSSSLLEAFFSRGMDDFRPSYVSVLCVCMRRLLVESRSTPKSNHATYTCRNLFFFFFSCPASRRAWWGPSLSVWRKVRISHTWTCILTWFWACALVPFCTFHQRLISCRSSE